MPTSDVWEKVISGPKVGKNAEKKKSRGGMKMYVVALVVILVAVAVFYVVLLGSGPAGTYTDTAVTGLNRVATHNDADRVANDLGSGLNDISGMLGDISSSLG